MAVTVRLLVIEPALRPMVALVGATVSMVLVLAVAWGDEWSNMLQPFWALAVLGPTRLEARDIFGYTTLIMLLTGPLYAAALLW